MQQQKVHIFSDFNWSVRLSVISFGFLGLLLTILLTWLIHEKNQDAMQTRIEQLTNSAEQLVKKRFEQYEYGLLGLRAAILTVDVRQLKRSNFERYMDSLDFRNEFPGARGFGFIRVVTPSTETDFINQARADGKPNFAIRTIDAHQQDRYVIQYIYPENNNNGATGLDIGSETNRRNAALTAALDGDAKLTAPITLVQAEGNKRSGFLTLLPLYDSALPQNSPESRLQATLGWVYAPLVVDEVLADLGPVLREMSIALTDGVETKPFFSSHTIEVLSDTGSFNEIRNIQFMGRQWSLETHSLPEMSAAMGIWSPVWVAILGLLLTSFFTVLLLISLSKQKHSHAAEDINKVGISHFLNSVFFKKFTLAYFLLIVLVFGSLALSFLFQEFESTSDSLIAHKQRILKLMQQHHQKYYNDLTFLQSTNAVREIVRAVNIAAETNDQSSLEDWKGRLGETFEAYVTLSQNVYQLRLIMANPNGSELIRIERKGSSIYLVPEVELQYKGDRPYMQQTLQFDSDKIWVSDLELNVENNVIEKPLRPTLRYAMPVLNENGESFGIIIINVDAKSLFSEMNASSLPSEVIYVINHKGDFVLHPNATKTFRSEFGEQYKWDNEFTLASAPFGLNNSESKLWNGSAGNILAFAAEFSPNIGEDIGHLSVKVTLLENEVYKKVLLRLSSLLLPLIGVSIFSYLMMYLIWIGNQRMVIATATERELDTQRRKDSMFKSLTELSPEAMVIVDSKGHIILVNSQAENLFGYVREDMLSQNISMLVPKSVAPNHDRYVKNYVSQPEVRPMGKGGDLFGCHSDGSEFPVEVSLSPVQLDDRLLIAASVRNISERQRIESSLRQATSEAKRANLAKSTFLANMSHEIRTPLNAVIGLTYLLGDSDLDDNQRNLVDKVQLSGRSLLGIVNEVLDLAKIEANEIELNEAPCQLHEFLAEVHSVFSSQAESKGLDLQLKLDPDLPIYVNTDEKLLRQILTNLLGNAIKFTIQGHITLSAQAIRSGSLSPMLTKVYFEVADTGIGVKKDVQDNIFQPFSQADSSTNRRFGGTGLCLSIVSSMVDLLQGELGMQSIPDEGSQFWLTLPMTMPSNDEIDTQDANLDALQVFIADDNPVDRQLLENLAKALGWTVFTVTSGVELVNEIMARVDSGRSLPDVLMVDWQMPEMDGLEALSILVDYVGHKKLPAVLIVSAYEREHIARLDVQHLADQILHKPISGSELFNAVNDVVVKHTGNSERVLQSTHIEALKARWLPRTNVLVVDDSEINLEVVGQILTRNGATVTCVSRGQAALDQLSLTPNAFDIVLMDVQMPEMDGLETTKLIRHQLGLNTLPIVALTAGTLEEEKKRALASGMNAFLTKPIEPPLLVTTLRQLIERYRSRVINVESLPSSSEVIRENWPTIIGIKDNADLLNGDLALFVDVLKRLFSEFHDLEAFAELATTKTDITIDRLALAAQIHKLRGSAGIIGAQELYQLAGTAEIALRSDADEINPLLIKLAQSLTNLRLNSAEFLSGKQYVLDKNVNKDMQNAPRLDPDKMKTLINALERQELEALTIVEKFSLSLGSVLGQEVFRKFEVNLKNLDFKNALDILNSTDWKFGETHK